MNLIIFGSKKTSAATQPFILTLAQNINLQMHQKGPKIGLSWLMFHQMMAKIGMS
jgi:hypothetical protein